MTKKPTQYQSFRLHVAMMVVRISMRLATYGTNLAERTITKVAKEMNRPDIYERRYSDYKNPARVKFNTASDDYRSMLN